MTPNNSLPLHPPKSATHSLVALIGVVSFLLILTYLRQTHIFGTDWISYALCLILGTASSIYLVDMAWQRVYKRSSTGLSFEVSHGSIVRTGIKYLGLLATLGGLAFLYWLLPEYHNNHFYHYFFDLFFLIAPYWLILAIPYFYWIDKHMVDPEDGYWTMGMIALGQWSRVRLGTLQQHVLGWIIKGFFLPLMFGWFCQDIESFFNRNLDDLTTFRTIYDFLFDFTYTVDVAFGTMGYCLSLRLTDTHLRSAESNTSGWVVAIMCYEPFWAFFGPHYFDYNVGMTWGRWLGDTPLPYLIWGCMILSLNIIYVWATVIFGARFSNLTHRGIITNGPYRWTKHPAYLSKNFSWWLISVPFLATAPWQENLRHCLMLLGLNLIYFLRAKTEEWHLSKDPTYVDYARWMDSHGIFSFMRRNRSSSGG